MKTLIFYIALFMGSVFAFNAHAYEMFYLSDATRFVHQNKDQHDPELIRRCNHQIIMGHVAIDLRDEGVTLDDALVELDNSIKFAEKKQEAKMVQSTRLEFERMFRTVYRHPDMTVQTYNQQFFVECMYLEGFE